MDLLEKLQYAHLPDISYIEKLYGAWSAEFSIDRSKGTIEAKILLKQLNNFL